MNFKQVSNFSRCFLPATSEADGWITMSYFLVGMADRLSKSEHEMETLSPVERSANKKDLLVCIQR